MFTGSFFSHFFHILFISVLSKVERMESGMVKVNKYITFQAQSSLVTDALWMSQVHTCQLPGVSFVGIVVGPFDISLL